MYNGNVTNVSKECEVHVLAFQAMVSLYGLTKTLATKASSTCHGVVCNVTKMTHIITPIKLVCNFTRSLEKDATKF